MLSLRKKIFIWQLPLVVAIFLFMLAYYIAQKQILLDQIKQTTSLALASGGDAINYALKIHGSGFLLLSKLMDPCHQHDESRSVEYQVVDALRHVEGFSALAVLDAEGLIIHSELSANDSNRYILRKTLSPSSLLIPELKEVLNQRLLLWHGRFSDYQRQLAIVEEQIIQLRKQGERNSQHYRNLQIQLSELQISLETPPVAVSFTGKEQVADLGLPFTGDTFVFMQPRVSCDGQLLGYLTAYLDRTLLDQILYRILNELADHRLSGSEVILYDQKSAKRLMGNRKLIPPDIPSNWLNSSSFLSINNPQGLLVRYPVVGSENLEYYLSLTRRDEAVETQSDLSLVIFISQLDIDAHVLELFVQISIFIVLVLVLFIVLIFVLTRHIVKPLSILRKGINNLATGKQHNPVVISSNDELGELAGSFNQMADLLQEKEAQLQALATTDSLTGTLNRRALTQSAEEEWERSRRHGAPLTVLLMDLDHFKQINDQFGHLSGDLVLSQFSRLIKGVLRSSDKFGRIGGEEFVVLLPQTSLSDGVEIAERMRQQVLQMSLKSEHGSNMRVRVSIGVAEWGAEESFEQVISRADRLLYRAKEQGRNRVES